MKKIWHPVSHETADRVTVVGHEYLELVDRARRDPDVEDVEIVRSIEVDEEGLLDNPDWTLDKFCPFVSGNMSLSVWPAFHDVKTVWAAGGIEVQRKFVMCFCSRFKVCKQMATCNLATLPGAGLVWKGDAWQHVEVVEAFFSIRHTELQRASVQ